MYDLIVEHRERNPLCLPRKNRRNIGILHGRLGSIGNLREVERHTVHQMMPADRRSANARVRGCNDDKLGGKYILSRPYLRADVPAQSRIDLLEYVRGMKPLHMQTDFAHLRICRSRIQITAVGVCNDNLLGITRRRIHEINLDGGSDVSLGKLERRIVGTGQIICYDSQFDHLITFSLQILYSVYV